MRNGNRRSLREWLRDFMWDRNGFDGLCRALWILLLALCVINVFVDSVIMSVIISGLTAYVLFRFLSKNLDRRRAENAAYYRLINKIKNFFKLKQSKRRDRRTHVYKKCPRCKNTLRFPRIRGVHVASCPCCHNKFDVKVR